MSDLNVLATAPVTSIRRSAPVLNEQDPDYAPLCTFEMSFMTQKRYKALGNGIKLEAGKAVTELQEFRKRWADAVNLRWTNMTLFNAARLSDDWCERIGGLAAGAGAQQVEATDETRLQFLMTLDADEFETVAAMSMRKDAFIQSMIEKEKKDLQPLSDSSTASSPQESATEPQAAAS